MYRELSGCLGIGRVHHYGTYGSSNVMVMDLLGASLEDLFTRCGRRFSLKTTLKLADQLLERVDEVRGPPRGPPAFRAPTAAPWVSPTPA